MARTRIYPDRILTPREKTQRSVDNAIARGQCCNCYKPRGENASSRYCRICLNKIGLRIQRNRRELKREVVNAYGGCCACCKETNIGFLTIDHVNNDGKADRHLGPNIYRKVRREGFPPKYQILCFNCNCGRSANGGTCPHRV